MVGKYLQRQNNRKYSSDTESFVFDVDAQTNRKQNSGNNVSSFIIFFPFCSTEVPCVAKDAIVCDSFSRKQISIVYCFSLLYITNHS